MAQELFVSVHNAEEKAEQTLSDAQQKARDLLKEAEAEIKAAERKASLDNRTKYQAILDQKRAELETNIEKQRPKVLSEQKESLQTARNKLPQVSQMIFERIWNDGDR